MIRKGIVTKVMFNRRTRDKQITVVDPDKYVPETRPTHNKNCKYDPDNRKGHGRGGYLKYGYGR